MIDKQIRFYQYHPFLLRVILILILILCCNFRAQIPDPDPERFSKEIEQFIQWDMKNSYIENTILFVGSSSIRLWPTALYFPNLYVINRGFGGSHISDVNYYYEQVVKKYKPSKIIFYAGDNDIAAGKSPDQVLEDFQNFTEKVEMDFPETLVFYLFIKPSSSRWQFWPHMLAANLKIKQFSEGNPNFFYIDTASPMLNDTGEPNPDLFQDDNLHLNDQGYQLWSKILLPYLEAN
jgi:lysophospholipase L1-like esterase